MSRRLALVACFSVLVLLAAAELLARATADFVIEPAKGLLLKLEDGAVDRMVERYRIDGVDMWRYESDGPRPATFKGDGFRILGVGDSIMAPFGLPSRQGFFDLLLARLQQHRPGLNYQGVNLSEGGFNLLQEKLLLRARGLALKPRLVLLQLWQDDDTAYRMLGDKMYTLKYYQAMERRAARQGKLGQLLNRSYLWARVELRRLRGEEGRTTLDVRQQLKEIHAACRSVDSGLLLLLSPDLDRPFDQQRDSLAFERIKSYAGQHGIPYLELKELLQGQDPKAIRLDNVHFNAKGHQLVAEGLFKRLGSSPLLRLQSRGSLSRHELCAAVARGDPRGCDDLPHHPGRKGDCLLQVSLKQAAKGKAGACKMNLTPMFKRLCEMLTGEGLACSELRPREASFDRTHQHFEKAETFLEVCKLLDAKKIKGCGPTDGRPIKRTLTCQIALALWAYLKRDQVVCRSLSDRRSRENCLAMQVDDVEVCTRWIDYSVPVDKAWYSRQAGGPGSQP